jgi:D-threonate/D-erythronate kinase
MHLLIVADDLTGALDSAVTLAAVGLHCVVARRSSDLPAAADAGAEVVAVSTASREGTVEGARAAVARVFELLPHRPAMVFKKIDSRLKGHIGAELAVVGGRTGIARAVVAPAIPAQGRATERGRLTGTGVNAPIDVAAAVAGSGLAIAVPDARSDADLDRVVAEALAAQALLVGAAGLAAALGRRLRPGGRAAPPPPLPAPVLFAIGSRDPITLAQVEVLRAGGVTEILAPDGHVAGPVSSGRAVLVRLVAGHGRLDPGAGPRFARTVAGLLGATAAGTLLACGGETADAILGELGVGVLGVEGEILPGVPVSRMVVNGRNMRLVTKSGGFGTPDALAAVARAAAGGMQED